MEMFSFASRAVDPLLRFIDLFSSLCRSTGLCVCCQITVLRWVVSSQQAITLFKLY